MITLWLTMYESSRAPKVVISWLYFEGILLPYQQVLRWIQYLPIMSFDASTLFCISRTLLCRCLVFQASLLY